MSNEYEFAWSLFHTSREAHEAIVTLWLAPLNQGNREQYFETLNYQEIADEAEEEWDLTGIDWYDREKLIEAIEECTK